MTSRVFSTPAVKGYSNASLYYFKRSAHSNPGFAKYMTRFGGEKIPTAGLADTYPGTPELTGKPNTDPVTTNITTLPNGIRVASIYSPSPVVSVGVYVTSGSRHETRAETGTTHFLKHLAFQSTRTMPGVMNTRYFEYIGANFTATAAREHILFETEVLQEHGNEVLGVLGELLHPRVLYHEVERQKPNIEEESTILSLDPVTSLFESVHRLAFRNRGLGKPLIAAHDNIHHLSHESLANYVSNHYKKSNTTIVVSGIPHDELVATIESKFAPETGSPIHVESAKPSEPSEPSKYIGGEAAYPSAGNTHIALAFEGVATKDRKDAAALAVLQKLLGGGLQSTRDAPGAGLQSRLHNNIVVPNKSVRSVYAFNISYSDTGLFGVYAEVAGDVRKVVESVVKEVSLVLGSIETSELDRAKQSVKADILSTKRLDTLHFVADQALSGASSIITPEAHAKSIDSITASDITRVARRVFSSRPTLVVQGDVSSVPQVETIQATLAGKSK